MAADGVPAFIQLYFDAGQTQAVTGSQRIQFPKSGEFSDLLIADKTTLGRVNSNQERGGWYLLIVNLIVQHGTIASRFTVTYPGGAGVPNRHTIYAPVSATDQSLDFSDIIHLPIYGTFELTGVPTAGTVTIQPQSSMSLFRLAGEDIDMATLMISQPLRDDLSRRRYSQAAYDWYKSRIPPA